MEWNQTKHTVSYNIVQQNYVNVVIYMVAELVNVVGDVFYLVEKKSK